MEFIDYYNVMGLSESASDSEVKRAYRKLARKYHPDVSQEPDAEARFKAVGEAYQVLKDPARRREYDELKRYRQTKPHPSSEQEFRPPPGWQTHAGFDGTEFTGESPTDFSDFFEELFGNRRYHRTGQQSEQHFSARGQDQHSQLTITLQDAFDGATLPLTMYTQYAHSDGSIRREPKSLQVKIPKGVADKQRIRLRGQGGPGLGDGPAGDLYIELTLADDDFFQHDGKDIIVNLPLKPWEAALGGQVKIRTLGGMVNMTVPPNASSGQKLRLRARGLPGNPPGDQFAVVSIHLPEAKTEEQKKFYRDMQNLWTTASQKKTGTGT